MYWKPVYAILEGAFQLVVANARQVKKVPGRKTDVKDAEWGAALTVRAAVEESHNYAVVESVTARVKHALRNGNRCWCQIR